MARARNIKPGFFTNDQLAELPALTRLFFAGLWTVCDRAGRVEDRPKKLKAEVMPYDSMDAEQALDDLCKAGFIARYEAEGVRVIQVLTWDKHQNPHIKEAASTLPEQVKHGISTVQEQCDAQPLPERAGLIPDSGFLIPSTLIPDSSPLIPSSVTDVTGDKSPTDRDLLFATGVPLLTAAGVSDKNARSMLAGLAKKHGDSIVADAIRQTAVDRPVEPVSWLQSLMPTATNGKPNAQEALEASNRAVVERYFKNKATHASV
jgi:hypothetical protein